MRNEMTCREKIMKWERNYSENVWGWGFVLCVKTVGELGNDTHIYTHTQWRCPIARRARQRVWLTSSRPAPLNTPQHPSSLFHFRSDIANYRQKYITRSTDLSEYVCTYLYICKYHIHIFIYMYIYIYMFIRNVNVK